MKTRSLSLVLLAAAALAGCASPQRGANFDAAALRALVPGVSTKADMDKIGKSDTPRTVTLKKDMAQKDLSEPMIVEGYSWYFSDSSAARQDPDLLPSRSGGATISHGKVLRFYSASSFQGELPAFDFEKGKTITKGKTTEQEVLGLMGAPTGRGIYPYAATPASTSVSYQQLAFNTRTRKIISRTLFVSFDANHVVDDIDLRMAEE
jgi:hypothetical protein